MITSHTIKTGIRRYLQGLGASLYLFLGAFLLKRHRRLLYLICEHFGFEDTVDTVIPVVPVSAVIGPATHISISELDAVDGNVSMLELVVLNSIVKQLGPAACFEIGTFDGRTALNIAASAGSQATIYTLDLPQADADQTQLALTSEDLKYVHKPLSGERFRGHALATQIVQLHGDSATFDYSRFKAGMDFVFVDGSHSYAYGHADSRTACMLLKPAGGVILWHDYGTWPGITRALNELYAGGGVFGGLRHIRGTSLCLLDLRQTGDSKI